MDTSCPVRVALLWHDTVISERLVTHGAVTVGDALDNTLCVPPAADLGARHPLLEAGRDAWMLFPTPAMGGRLHVGGRERALTEVPTPVLRSGDWAHLDLGSFALFVQAGGEPVAKPGGPAHTLETPILGGLAAALSLHLAVLIAAFLLYEEKPSLVNLNEPDRITRIITQTVPQQEKEAPPIAEETQDDPGKRPPGKEGTWGEPEQRRRARPAKREGDLVNKIKEVGIHKALGSNVLGGPLKNVLGDARGLSEKLTAAMAGPEGEVVMGHGSEGIGLRGVHDGGGGDGSFGRIGAMGTVDLGGGPGVRSTLRGKPKKPTVTAAPPPPGAIGQFCKEADVQRVVTTRRGGVQHCYDRALASNPELSGKLTLVWRIALDGTVAHVAVDHSSLGDREVEGCVMRSVRTWKFTPPDGGMCQIRYPFVFSSGL